MAQGVEPHVKFPELAFKRELILGNMLARVKLFQDMLHAIVANIPGDSAIKNSDYDHNGPPCG